ncbi:MAG: serine/threonine-protein kinase [Myxococcota bacterium]|nr:serine/threonine-protein kinase [Myxococcota bacterium]
MTSSSGQYLILKKIAVGGMAEIFLARRVGLGGFGKFVVVKRLSPEYRGKPAFESLFVSEAKLSARLGHGNTIQLHDLGQEGGAYFMVMEYVHGVSSAELMARAAYQRAPIPPQITLQIIYRTALALAYCESASTEEGESLQVLHHDVSPHNIQIRFDGIVKLLDFGVATQLCAESSGGRRGKFAYMSPEALQRQALDHRSDQFSLGVVFFELLTGRRLFKGKTPAETQQKAEQCVVPRLRSLRSDIPALLEDIVLKMLAKDRVNRFVSFAELAERIERSARMLSYPLESRVMGEFLQQTYGEELQRRVEELESLCGRAEERAAELLKEVGAQQPQILFYLNDQLSPAESAIPLAGERGERDEWEKHADISEVKELPTASQSGKAAEVEDHLLSGDKAGGVTSTKRGFGWVLVAAAALIAGVLMGQLLFGGGVRLFPSQAQEALISIKSEPEGALVSADGIPLGLTPLLAFPLELKGERVIIDLSHPGYQSMSEIFTVGEDRHLQLRALLRRAE